MSYAPCLVIRVDNNGHTIKLTPNDGTIEVSIHRPGAEAFEFAGTAKAAWTFNQGDKVTLSDCPANIASVCAEPDEDAAWSWLEVMLQEAVAGDEDGVFGYAFQQVADDGSHAYPFTDMWPTAEEGYTVVRYDGVQALRGMLGLTVDINDGVVQS